MIDQKRVDLLMYELCNRDVIGDIPDAIEPYSEKEFGSDNGYLQYLTGMVEGLSSTGYSHTELKRMITARLFGDEFMNEQDQDFAEFRRQAKYSIPGMSEHNIGAAWMRGQKWNAKGIDAMVYHKPDEAPKRTASDIRLSLSYGALAFKSFIPHAALSYLVDDWQECIDTYCDGEPRAYTRKMILQSLIEQHYPNEAVVPTSATLWLVMTLPTGTLISDGTYKTIHYEITEIADRDGHRGHNFRLALLPGDEPLPDLVHTMPSPFDGLITALGNH